MLLAVPTGLSGAFQLDGVGDGLPITVMRAPLEPVPTTGAIFETDGGAVSGPGLIARLIGGGTTRRSQDMNFPDAPFVIEVIPRPRRPVSQGVVLFITALAFAFGAIVGAGW